MENQPPQVCDLRPTSSLEANVYYYYQDALI